MWHVEARDASLQPRSCMVQKSLTRSFGYLVFIGAIDDLESDKYSVLLEELVVGGGARLQAAVERQR